MLQTILITLLFQAAVMLAGDSEALTRILDEVAKHPPFDVSPRYINFRPAGRLKQMIDKYVQGQARGRLDKVEKRLAGTNDGFEAVACLYIAARFEPAQATDVLERYRSRLTGQKINLREGYPDAFAVTQQLDAMLPQLKKQIRAGVP